MRGEGVNRGEEMTNDECLMTKVRSRAPWAASGGGQWSARECSKREVSLLTSAATIMTAARMVSRGSEAVAAGCGERIFAK